MCVEGEGSQGSPVPPRPRNFLSSLKLVLCGVGDVVSCRGWAEGSAGKEAVGESLGSCSPEQEQLRSVPSQSVNAFSPDSWHRLTICFFSPLEIQAGMISQDLEAGEGRREEPIALNKMKPEKAGAFWLSQGRHCKCDNRAGGWTSQHALGKDALGWLPRTPLRFHLEWQVPSSSGVPRCAQVCQAQHSALCSHCLLNPHNHPRRAPL